MNDGPLERADDGAFPYLLHGGDAPVQAQWYFRTTSRLPVAVHRWRFPPGASEGDHVHGPGGPGALDELYLLVSGRATMTVGGERVVLAPGDAVLAPAGVEHGVSNHGSESAEFVVVFGHPGEPVDWSAYGTGRAAERATTRE